MRLAYVTYFADFAPLWKDPRYEGLLVRMGVRESGAPPASTRR